MLAREPFLIQSCGFTCEGLCLCPHPAEHSLPRSHWAKAPGAALISCGKHCGGRGGVARLRVHLTLDTEFCPGAYLSQLCRYAQDLNLPLTWGMSPGSTSSPHPAHEAMVL